MKRKMFSSLLLISICGVLLSGCGGDKLKDALNYDVEHFEMTNQLGEKFGSDNLKGKVWLADFMFTSCTTVCPPMTANMTNLQKQLEANDLDVQIISFSVDPTIDTPEKLNTYIKKYNVDEKKWNLLTGYSQDYINGFAQKNFRTLANKPAGTDQVLHGTKFYLINQDGKVVKEYSGIENTPYQDIISDAKILLK